MERASFNTIYDWFSFKQIVIGSATFVTIRVILFVYNRYKLYQTFRKLAIPGPDPNLLDGHLKDKKEDKAEFMVVQRWKERYGKVFGYFIGDLPILMISDPVIIRKFLINNQEVFINRAPPFIDVRPLSQSILFARGNHWKSMRKVLTPAFSLYRFKGEEGTRFIDDSISLMIDYLAKKHRKCRSMGDSMIVDIHSLMKATALHLISKMAIELEDVKVIEDEQHVKVLDEYLEQCDGSVVDWAIRLPILQSIASFIGSNITLGKIQEDILRELRAKMNKLLHLDTSKSHNIFETMVQLHKEGSLEKIEVLGNSVALLFAGYDTTATTLAYFFWAISKHKDIQDRLRSEIISHGCDSAYLKMVLNETMRLYPTVISFTQREASKDITIDGLTIKKGVVVIVNSWLLHRDPDIWHEPENFNPERFSDMKKVDTCAFVPFGIGNRLCLGYQLAMLEMRLIATELLMTYDFNLVSPNILSLVTSGNVLTKPIEKIKLELKPLYVK